MIFKLSNPFWDKVTHCFCLPVQPSFYAWGMSKIVISVLLLLCFGGPGIRILLYSFDSLANILEGLCYNLFPVTFVVDIVLHGMFIKGIHEKSKKLLRLYYNYCQIMLLFTPTVIMIYTFLVRNEIVNRWWFYDSQINKLLFTAVVTMFVSLIIQSYIMLLVRNEIIKMRHMEFKLLIDSLCYDKVADNESFEEKKKEDNIEINFRENMMKYDGDIVLVHNMTADPKEMKRKWELNHYKRIRQLYDIE